MESPFTEFWLLIGQKSRGYQNVYYNFFSWDTVACVTYPCVSHVCLSMELFNSLTFFSLLTHHPLVL